MRAWGVAVLLLGTVAMVASAGDVRFAALPSATVEGNGVKIAFAVSEPIDAEVSIVDGAGRVLRHLAAGMLGDSPPAPFQKGLHQSLVWNMKDDDGRTVDKGDAKVRVRLGINARFDKIMGWSGQWLGELCGMTAGPDGMLYVLHRGDWVPHRHTWMIVAFDKNGRYHHQVYPARGGLPPDERRGWPWITTADGQEMPMAQHLLNRSVHPAAAFLSVTTMLATSDGRLLVPTGGEEGYRSDYPDIRGGRRLLILGTDGSVPDNFLGPIYAPANYAGNAFLALSPDEQHVYISGLSETAKKSSRPCHVVWKMSLSADAKPEVFLGKLFQEGNGAVGLKNPQGLAVDKAGNLYVADAGNNRLAVFKPDGVFLDEIPIEVPEQVHVSRKTGEIAVLTLMPDPKRRILRSIVKFAGLREKHPQAVLGPLQGPGPEAALFTIDDTGDSPTYFYGGVGFGDNTVYKVAGSTREFVAGYNRFKREPAGDIGFTGDLAFANGQLLSAGPSSWTFRGNRWATYDADSGKFNGYWQTLAGDGKPDKHHLGHGELVSGKDGNLYSQVILGSIARYGADGKALDFDALGSHVVRNLHQVHSRQTGLFVTPKGTIYVPAGMQDPPLKQGQKPKNRIDEMNVVVIDKNGTVREPSAVRVEDARMAGIVVDSKGCIYLGVRAAPRGDLLPSWIKGRMPPDVTPQASATYENVATIFKFPPTGGEIIADANGQWQTGLFDSAPGTVKNAEWSLRAGLVPQKMLAGAQGCYCETTRFDIDEYDRLYIPDTLRYSVLVVDSAGNQIARIGNYGNMDNRGPGSPAPSPEIAFAWPLSAQYSDGRLYVADYVNMRLMAVRFEFAKEAASDIR